MHIDKNNVNFTSFRFLKVQPPIVNPVDLEKLEEEKLKAKYPTAGSGLRGNGPSGHSAFLQKRLQKGVGLAIVAVLLTKYFIWSYYFKQKYFDSGDYQMAKQKGGGIKQVFANKVTTGDAIPTPESVPARKTSIIQPCNKFPSS